MFNNQQFLQTPSSFIYSVNWEKFSRFKQYKYPIYGIDDDTAIKIDGDKLEVVSQGVWKKFEK